MRSLTPPPQRHPSQLRERGREVILSLHDDEATRKQAAAAGATAFLSKQAADTALVDVLREAAEHERP